MATFEERLQKVREQRRPTDDTFNERLKRIREGQVKPKITKKIQEEESKVVKFGKELIRGITRPVAKSFLAPGQLIVSLATGETPVDLTLPFLGDVTPPQSIKGGIGTALQTGLLGVGGATAKNFGTQLLKTAGKEAAIGAGFGLGVGLEEDKKGKELILPTAIGASLGFLAPPTIKATQIPIKKVLIPAAKKTLIPARKLFSELANTSPVKFISSVKERLKRFGDPGTKIVEGFENVDKEKLLRSGAAIDNLDNVAFNRLNNEEATLLLDALEGRIQKSELPSNTLESFNVIDSLRTEIANEAQKTGLQVTIKRGETRPFFPQKNFFPHFIPDPQDLKKGKLREEILDNSIRIGKFKDKETAVKVLDDYIAFTEQEGRGGKEWVKYLVDTGQANNMTEARGLALRVLKTARLKKFGSLERSRIVDFPFYDPDPRRVIPKYILGSFERLETIKEFGQKSRQLDKQLGRIQNLQGIDAGREARRIINNVTGNIERAPKGEKFSLGLRAIQIPKLSFAQIINIGQPIVNGILKADIPSVAFGMTRAFTQLGRRRALRAGATLDSTIREALNKAGAEGSFASKFLKLTGFTATEKFNRVAAANTGMRYLERTFEKLKKRPDNKVLRARIEELGLDPDTLLNKGVTEKDVLTAGQKFTNITQFRGRPIDLPLFVNSPEGKVFFQFKTFAFSQSKLLKDTIKKDLLLGNWTGVLRNLLVLSTIFPMTGEVLENIKSLVTRKPRPTNALDRYIDDLVSVGSLGIAPDLWRSAEFGSLAESLAGPTIASGVKGTENIVRSINQGRVTDSTIKWLMNQFGILRPLKNTIFPPKER